MYYQNVVRVLEWLIELERIDTNLEVSSFSSYMIQSRMGHLIRALNISNYVWHHSSSWIVYNSRKIDINWSSSNIIDTPWKRAEVIRDLYLDSEERILLNASIPRRNSIQLNTWVYADHSGDKATSRFQTIFVIFAN